MHDYTNEKRAPVLICFVRHGGKYLLLKRSDRVLAYKNKWSIVAGFLDERDSMIDHIARELSEELGCGLSAIERIEKVDVYDFRDEMLDRTWVRHVFVADVRSPRVKLDWEHTECKWVTPDEIEKFDTTPGLKADLQKVVHI
jgi:8-oxo-dGTP diphosphatase